MFDATATQQEIYETCVTQLVDSSFEGYNATSAMFFILFTIVLAYGQTGSGKTYTMGTSGRVSNVVDTGIIPRFIYDVFQRKKQTETENPGSEVAIHVSFLEIYGETVRDLLEMDQSANKEVIIRSDKDGGVKVLGQKLQQVTSAEELLELLDNGSLYRATGETAMNAFSSRSHAIFTIYIDQEIPRSGFSEEEDNSPYVRQSKFHFVDLAGSERLSRTRSEGKQQHEGIDINKGLLVLGKVIRALGDEKMKNGYKMVVCIRGRFPPYRESKLTRLLMDSLGGNAKTLMIACVR